MIFYEGTDEHGRKKLAGTQADAKAIDRNFKQIEIPTDKAGLMAYVQNLLDQIYGKPESTTGGLGSGDHNQPDCPVSDGEAVNLPDQEDLSEKRIQTSDKLTAREPGYAEKSVWTDEQFFNLPLAHRLTLASVTLEDVREKIGMLKL